MATKEVIETDAIVGENTLEQDIMDALDDNEELSSDDVTEADSPLGGPGRAF